ncbi:LysR family transcriptional regulator [Microlunatus antarcticus]|uniref:DNA-binding transcriptional LysR family regulator n=1 Tax=Microlunatus antarcticus TaxID=53388 RepID=A0A7W5JSW7_9ACTN|nr:DNA-binding transcriptional LysR family regulator [Microlunatus antarcticus]
MSTTSLRVLREVAERGSFSAAAVELGYTQSGISRQVAVLEQEVGHRLFERRTAGVRLTPAGQALLRHAAVVLDELEAARRELAGESAGRTEVRLGAIISAGAVLVPQALKALRLRAPGLAVTTREGTTPALVRAVRAGSLDLAVVTARPPFRPPDDELPALEVETLAEARLLVAVPAAGRFAGRTSVEVAELADVDWIASPGTGSEPLLGVWPGLAGRPRVAHSAKDWLTKLHLVAAGCGLTTIPANLAPVLPEGVQMLEVTDGTDERRRLLAVRPPGDPAPAIEAVLRALRDVARNAP